MTAGSSLRRLSAESSKLDPRKRSGKGARSIARAHVERDERADRNDIGEAVVQRRAHIIDERGKPCARTFPLSTDAPAPVRRIEDGPGKREVALA